MKLKFANGELVISPDSDAERERLASFFACYEQTRNLGFIYDPGRSMAMMQLVVGDREKTTGFLRMVAGFMESMGLDATQEVKPGAGGARVNL